MAVRKWKWSLEDLVDFEARLRESGVDEGRDLRRLYRKEAGKLDDLPKAESDRRRVGLRIWLHAAQSARPEPHSTGRRLNASVRLAGVVLGLLAFMAGVGVLRGLLQSTEMFVRGYNVWLFLGVTLGLQWVLLLGSLVGYALLRRGRGALSVFQQAASWLTRRFAGGMDRTLWQSLLEGGAGYRSALSWRLARLTQGAAILFNLGLIAGFLGCLFFLSVRFYWESTFEGSGRGLIDFAEGMAAPWSWTGEALPPDKVKEVGYSVLAEPTTGEELFYEREGVDKMWSFLLVSLAVYGLLPRILFWLWCLYKERRALAALDFQAPRHRELWRALSKTERKLASHGAGDGVVLVNVGDIDIDAERIRKFLLQELRVNPQATYAAEVLDEKREQEAFEAIKEADLGVVFLVEGWALSPKQMSPLHERVRALGGTEIPINYLVVGELRSRVPSPPDEEEWTQWKRFVDSLRDPAAEVVAFQETPEREVSS